MPDARCNSKERGRFMQPDSDVSSARSMWIPTSGRDGLVHAPRRMQSAILSRTSGCRHIARQAERFGRARG
jgi:hypothetical protein